MNGNNRFTKWIFKTLYRLTHSRKYHHNKNLWPYFSVIRNARGRIKTVCYKKRSINLSALTFNSNRKPLILMATGPSVKDIDSGFFSDDFDYFGVNGAFSMKCAHFNWYAIVDRDFVRERLSLVKEVVARGDLTLFCTYASLEAILSSIDGDDIHCQFNVFETANSIRVRRFLQPQVAVNIKSKDYFWHDEIGFSDNIADLVFDYGTVTYPALQIACALGYRKIYIVGLDMNNFTVPRFYETADNKLGTRLDQDFDDINRAFVSAQAYCKAHGIDVINLSPNSALDAFPKRSWDSVCVEEKVNAA